MWLFWSIACEPTTETPTVPVEGEPRADVVHVSVTGDPGAYTFGVTIRSDETGCDQYANWWEVLTPEGALVYRRILDHSHTNEQPFTRTGGPVDVPADAEVVARAHLYLNGDSGAGYAGAVLRGTATNGFVSWEPPQDWALDVEDDAPQPDGCLF